jgi:hypothetical protein
VDIRYTTAQDLEKVMTIYAYARIQMKSKMQQPFLIAASY